jgi:hypothetical protein
MVDQISEYLFDSSLARQPGYVYIGLWPNSAVSTPEMAMNFLRAKSQPIPLVPVQWGGRLTVIVEANVEPRIWIGRRSPTGNWEADLGQILRVLGENGVEAELSLDTSQLASRGSQSGDWGR